VAFSLFRVPFFGTRRHAAEGPLSRCCFFELSVNTNCTSSTKRCPFDSAAKRAALPPRIQRDNHPLRSTFKLRQAASDVSKHHRHKQPTVIPSRSGGPHFPASRSSRAKVSGKGSLRGKQERAVTQRRISPSSFRCRFLLFPPCSRVRLLRGRCFLCPALRTFEPLCRPATTCPHSTWPSHPHHDVIPKVARPRDLLLPIP